MNELHPEFKLMTATSGMYSSLKSLPKPPSVLSASRTLRCISANGIYPIGVKWSPFLNPGQARKKVARLLSSKANRSPRPYRNKNLGIPCQGRF